MCKSLECCHSYIEVHIYSHLKGLLYGHNNDTRVVCFSDADRACYPYDKRCTFGYVVWIDDNLISWKSDEQNVVIWFSAEAKYRSMALATCELISLTKLLKELQFGEVSQMTLRYDNLATFHFSLNLVFLERTKRIEINCYFISVLHQHILHGRLKLQH